MTSGESPRRATSRGRIMVSDVRAVTGESSRRRASEMSEKRFLKETSLCCWITEPFAVL